MSEFNITIEGGTSKRLPTAGKYVDRDIIVTAEGGAEDLEAVLTEQEALIDELKEVLQGKASGGGSPIIAKSLVRIGIGYIDTGINGANSNLKIEIRYEFLTMPSGYFYVIRAYQDESTNATRILYNKNTAVYNCLNSIPSKSLTSTGTRYANVVYTDILKPESLTAFSYQSNGAKTTATRTSGAALEGKNILLFSNTTSSDNVTIKVYYLKIYDGITLVRDYAPFVTKNGECGLYDRVTKQFYGNSGDGKFEVDK